MKNTNGGQERHTWSSNPNPLLVRALPGLDNQTQPDPGVPKPVTECTWCAPVSCYDLSLHACETTAVTQLYKYDIDSENYRKFPESPAGAYFRCAAYTAKPQVPPPASATCSVLGCLAVTALLLCDWKLPWWSEGSRDGGVHHRPCSDIPGAPRAQPCPGLPHPLSLLPRMKVHM
jgi:hypothetical protein